MGMDSTAKNSMTWNLVVSKGSKPTPEDQNQSNILNTVALESKQRLTRAKNLVIREVPASPSIVPATAKVHD